MACTRSAGLIAVKPSIGYILHDLDLHTCCKPGVTLCSLICRLDAVMDACAADEPS